MTGKMIVWGRDTSVNVQKVLWALEELGLDYERIDKGGKFGGLDQPDYLALNPNSLVPTLQDGDVRLWESHAIVRYLSNRYGEGFLLPDDWKTRALAEQWCEWAQTRFQPAWLTVFVSLVRVAPSKQDPAAIAAAVEKCGPVFEILDRALADRPYITGDTFSFADIPLGSAMYRWTRMDFDRPHFPSIAEWHQRLQARPAYGKSVEIDYSDLIARD